MKNAQAVQPVSGRSISIFIEIISFKVLEIWVPNRGEGLNSGAGFPLKLLEVKQFIFNSNESPAVSIKGSKLRSH